MALAAEMRRLTDTLRQADRGRLEAVATLRGDAARYLTDLWSARQDMASALARDLDEASAVRHTAESDRRVQMAQATRQRAAYLRSVRSSVASTLKTVRSAHQRMARALARDLDEASAVRHTAESDRRVQMAQATRQRAADLRSARSSVASMLKELRNDFAAAHRAWNELGLSMHRAGAAAADSSAAGTPADATAAEPLSERVVRYLGEHPMGQRLGELQKVLGAPRRQLARLMDELIETGKARLDKQGLYLARR